MIAWAAVDVLDGRAVRLRRGRRDDITDFGPAAGRIAGWLHSGLKALHLVDLGAAFGDSPSLLTLLDAMGSPPRGVLLQVGGGIRSAACASELVQRGADRVVVGSLVFKAPEEAAALVRELGPERCVAALDTLDGRVRVAGWREDAGSVLQDAVESARELGYERFLVTDIARDGLMAGPNLSLYAGLPAGLAFTASGGIRSAADLKALDGLPGAEGAVVGRALYDGTMRPEDLKEYGP